MLTAERPTPVPETATARTSRGTSKERRAAGKALRTNAPLESHAAFSRTPASRDPLTLLEEQAVTRLPDLVPIRYGPEFGETYADVNDGDHLQLAEAAASGRVQARSDL
jgi:hypothetical protein